MGSGFNVVATYDSGFKDGIKAVVIRYYSIVYCQSYLL